MPDQITVQLKGIPEAIRDLKKWKIFKVEGLKIVLTKAGFKVQKLAKETIIALKAVDTGRLLSDVQVDLSGLPRLLVRVGTNVYYAVYVEFGTVKMSARPFMFPSLFMLEGEIVKDIARVLKKDIRLI